MYLPKLRSEQMIHGNEKSFFNMMHTSAEDLATLAHPRGWVHQEIKGDLGIYIDSQYISTCIS